MNLSVCGKKVFLSSLRVDFVKILLEGELKWLLLTGLVHKTKQKVLAYIMHFVSETFLQSAVFFYNG